jgi:hypothetical protein
MIYIEDIIPNCISFSELENHTLNQAELNEIKYIKENNKIFEVPLHLIWEPRVKKLEI